MITTNILERNKHSVLQTVLPISGNSGTTLTDFFLSKRICEKNVALVSFTVKDRTTLGNAKRSGDNFAAFGFTCVRKIEKLKATVSCLKLTQID